MKIVFAYFPFIYIYLFTYLVRRCGVVVQSLPSNSADRFRFSAEPGILISILGLVVSTLFVFCPVLSQVVALTFCWTHFREAYSCVMVQRLCYPCGHLGGKSREGMQVLHRRRVNNKLRKKGNLFIQWYNHKEQELVVVVTYNTMSPLIRKSKYLPKNII